MLRVSNVARNQLELNMEQQVRKEKVQRTWLGNVFHAISKAFSTAGTLATATDRAAKNYGALAVTQSSRAVKKLDADIRKEYGVSLAEFNKEVEDMVDDLYD